MGSSFFPVYGVVGDGEKKVVVLSANSELFCSQPPPVFCSRDIASFCCIVYFSGVVVIVSRVARDTLHTATVPFLS